MDDCGCRTYLALRRAAGFTLSSTEYLFTELCGLRDCSKAKAHPYSHSHRTGPPMRDRSRNGTRAIRSSVTLLSTFAWKISSTNCPRRTTSAIGRLVASRASIRAMRSRAWSSRHQAFFVRLVVAQNICGVDQHVSSDRATDFGGVAFAGLRYHRQRLANPQDQVSENSIGASARHRCDRTGSTT
jgi:hypothetical protein